MEDEILHAYIDTLKFPKEKPQRQFFLCPIGYIQSGKTTVMKELCKNLHLLKISTDEIREIQKIVFDIDTQDYAPNIALTLIKKYAKEGYSIGIDANNGGKFGREKRNALESFANKIGASILYIHIDPPESFILDNLTKQTQPSYLYKNNEEALERYYQTKKETSLEGIPITYTFDTSNTDTFQQQIVQATNSILMSLAS